MSNRQKELWEKGRNNRRKKEKKFIDKSWR